MDVKARSRTMGAQRSPAGGGGAGESTWQPKEKGRGHVGLPKQLQHLSERQDQKPFIRTY